jgi:hypothetical protein
MDVLGVSLTILYPYLLRSVFFLNAGMPDCLASSQSGTRMKKCRCWTQSYNKQSGVAQWIARLLAARSPFRISAGHPTGLQNYAKKLRRIRIGSTPTPQSLTSDNTSIIKTSGISLYFFFSVCNFVCISLQYYFWTLSCAKITKIGSLTTTPA